MDAKLYEELTAAFKGALPGQEAAAARMQRTDGDAVAKLLQRRARAEEESGPSKRKRRE